MAGMPETVAVTAPKEAVRLLVITELTGVLTVEPLCTNGNTSVPASGVDAEVSAEIFLSAMIYP
jgi:hypothetical protein